MPFLHTRDSSNNIKRVSQKSVRLLYGRFRGNKDVKNITAPGEAADLDCTLETTLAFESQSIYIPKADSPSQCIVTMDLQRPTRKNSLEAEPLVSIPAHHVPSYEEYTPIGSPFYLLDPEGLVTLDFWADHDARIGVKSLLERTNDMSLTLALHQAALSFPNIPYFSIGVVEKGIIAGWQSCQHFDISERGMMPNPDYMTFQSDATRAMRSRVVAWLIQLQSECSMKPETLWMAVNIVDRFASLSIISARTMSFVGVAALLMASKCQKFTTFPTFLTRLDAIISVIGEFFSQAEILKAQRVIQSTLKDDFSDYCSPHLFILRLIKMTDDRHPIKKRILCSLFLDLALLDYRFVRLPPSMVAAVAMFSARRMLCLGWPGDFAYRSRYSAEQLEPASNLLQAKLLEEDNGEYVWRKYDWFTNSHARNWVLATQEGNSKTAGSAALRYVSSLMLVQREIKPLF